MHIPQPSEGVPEGPRSYNGPTERKQRALWATSEPSGLWRCRKCTLSTPESGRSPLRRPFQGEFDLPVREAEVPRESGSGSRQTAGPRGWGLRSVTLLKVWRPAEKCSGSRGSLKSSGPRRCPLASRTVLGAPRRQLRRVRPTIYRTVAMR